MSASTHATEKPVKLQYWSSSHSVNAPDRWPEPYGFETVEDAVAFAATQAPANRELAWLRKPDGTVMTPEQILRAFQMRAG
ncbi:MAG: hypothetical protein B7Y12_20875 [Rhizobiales bacterium 24-66-13]|jgi:hypothetical protein|uniref:hypothetical protein n=1 Tax=Roseixanthobacter finlandensis TaxID=3119922 RepID=UPI000BD4BD5B|nr:MAG: hypothetical protein B7Z45_03965 [Azorhizobium sp. 12-66-6]OYZ68156.1 MAG: hypothetical protein B7Y12_20875 [Rhizobiales bacterium 24-66-13]OZB02295.1 MAG: hypothetical protein B7X67_20260 [Rhizobiales bacterium 39-66-18]HQS08891.1 hypothetical protein [Xanthobacteraceae bacterium]